MSRGNDGLDLSRLNELYGETGKSQETISKRLGWYPQKFGEYLRGAKRPGLATLIDIADYFNVSLDYLTDRDEYIAPAMSEADKSFVQMYLSLPEVSKYTLQRVALNLMIGGE